MASFPSPSSSIFMAETTKQEQLSLPTTPGCLHKRELEEEEPTQHQPSRKKFKNPRKQISIHSSASEICEAFFQCMDFDGNGFIEESESKILSVIAFDKNLDEADEHWKAMLESMDSDHDQKISKQEYIAWWTQRHASQNIQENGTFQAEYASYLLTCLQRISSVKVAQKMCDTFFDAMDVNHDGYLEEGEIKNVSRWAFGESLTAAEARWKDMLQKMDVDHDCKISKQEYRTYWLSIAKSKIQPDGTFVEGYKRYLLRKLVKIKNGNHRQEQIRKWTKANPNHRDSLNMPIRQTIAFIEEA